MNKTLLFAIKTALRFIPNVPPLVYTILDAAEDVATPEEFHGKINKLLTLVPIQENK